MMFLCTGSKPIVPAINGLEKVTYYTSDTILKLDQLPKSIAIIGGGYSARARQEEARTQTYCVREQAESKLTKKVG
jgi:cation diffusion facilitator CzcD-associated flavoprotein CzcO